MKRRAFTLVELLFVIVIIGTLVAILLPVLAAAMRAAKRASVAAEITSFTQAIASFTLSTGEVPPSRFACSETGDYSPKTFAAAGIPDSVRARSIAFLRMHFPKVSISIYPLNPRPQIPVSAADNPLAIPGCYFYDFNGDQSLQSLPYVLTGDETLVYFLGGMPKPHVSPSGNTIYGLIGFCNDPRNPFQTDIYPDPAAPLKIITTQRLTPNKEFASGRLFDLDGDGMPSYADPYSGSENPTAYAYFAPLGGLYDPDDCNQRIDPSDPTRSLEPSGDTTQLGVFMTSGQGQAAGKVATSPAPNPYAISPVVPVTGPYETGPLAAGFLAIDWQSRASYQIICAGDDRQFGPGGWYDPRSTTDKLPWPANANATAVANATGRTASPDPLARRVENDNLTSFAGGPLGP